VQTIAKPEDRRCLRLADEALAMPRRCREFNFVSSTRGAMFSHTVSNGQAWGDKPMSAKATQAVDPIESETMRRVSRRLIPLLMICYFAAYLDRVNVGFAALTMNKALALSAEIFGIGSGIFFLGYFLFEVPSNLILEKVGARRWIARILISWGVISGVTAFVTGTWSFLGIRFLLGLAEAGFYPGIILYLTWWFPASYRSRIIGIFMTAIPISIVTGSLISSQILRLGDWGGLASWQWLFILEAMPAVILGFVVMTYLTDRPEQAKWLEPAQRDWLVRRLADERSAKEARHTYSLTETMRHPRVWLLTLVYFGQNVSGYGLVIFLPQIVSRFGVGVGMNGLISALPFAAAAIAMVWWGTHADRRNEHRLHTAAACFLNFAGLAVCVFLDDPILMMAAIILSQMGQSAIAPTFWALPTAMLTGTAAAGGIAMINAIGNLGGFLGPFMMGSIKDATGSFTIGLLSIAMGTLVATIVLLAMGPGRHEATAADPTGRAAAE
jgi:MFS transporter, ACS family, tartrate transporter